MAERVLVAVIKHMTTSIFEKNEFICIFGSRGIRVHCGGEAGQQGAVMVEDTDGSYFKQQSQSRDSELEVTHGL